jgi:hypothetical protein
MVTYSGSLLPGVEKEETLHLGIQLGGIEVQQL